VAFVALLGSVLFLLLEIISISLHLKGVSIYLPNGYDIRVL
jgi:hypothetical protein